MFSNNAIVLSLVVYCIFTSIIKFNDELIRTSLTISCNIQGSPVGNATPVLDSMWAISEGSEVLVVIGEKFQLYNIKFDYSNEGRLVPYNNSVLCIYVDSWCSNSTKIMVATWSSWSECSKVVL